jgi:hypothetical protein
MLFSQTVTASQLRDKLRDFLLKVTGRNVLQIVHRGQPIRVLMTQEHYLTLLGKIAAFEEAAGHKTVPHRTADEMDRQIADSAEHLLADEERPRKKSVHG